MDHAKSAIPRTSGQVAAPQGGIEKIIKVAIERGASDIHIKAGDVFRARIDGKLVPLTKQRLTPEQTKAIALRLIPNQDERANIEKLRDYDCSWGMPGVGRFRVNMLRQRSSLMIVMRVIPFDVPSFESLELPPILQAVALATHGLALVTGPTGSGKSSTMAAMVNHINQNQQRHIVTLESPIEFLHRDIKSSVTQREIGVDTDDYRRGLRATLRQDPDVVLIADLRDATIVDTALKAVETGHLVISALDTPDAETTVARVVSMFQADDQEVARRRLADSLLAVDSQRLLRRADGRGRVAAVEVLLCTGAARDIIRDPRRAPEMPGYLRISREEYGTQTFDQHLVDLVAAGVVTHEAAMTASPHPADLELQIRGLPHRPPQLADQVASSPPPMTDDLSSILPSE
jgi:twitching motility protein PilT